MTFPIIVKIVEPDEIEGLRHQLKILDEALHEIDMAIKGMMWYGGDLPAEPDLYEPEDWQTDNIPVYRVFENAVGELEHDGYPEYAEKLRNLPIDVLLAESRDVDKYLQG